MVKNPPAMGENSPFSLQGPLGGEDSLENGMATHSITVKTKIRVSCPITSRQTDGVKKCKQWHTLLSWAPKSMWMATATMKLKDVCLLLGRRAMRNLDSIRKSRDNTLLLTIVHIVKAMVFPVAMYRCESWVIKKVEC